jgi:dephospho-CoA kinase
MKDIKVIGLTGTYCAGKNHVALLLEKRSLPALDLDKLGHEVIEMEKEQIVLRFGDDILAPNGMIDRKKLGQKVFGRSRELSALEDIIHPAVNRETLAWINAIDKGREKRACVVNAALLHRSSAFELLDAVIIVEAPVLVRLLRAKKRDKLPWLSLFKRFQSQRNFNYQFFKEKTDIYRVSNPSGLTDSARSEGEHARCGFLKRYFRNRLEKRIDGIIEDIIDR